MNAKKNSRIFKDKLPTNINVSDSNWDNSYSLVVKTGDLYLLKSLFIHFCLNNTVEFFS